MEHSCSQGESLRPFHRPFQMLVLEPRDSRDPGQKLMFLWVPWRWVQAGEWVPQICHGTLRRQGGQSQPPLPISQVCMEIRAPLSILDEFRVGMHNSISKKQINRRKKNKTEKKNLIFAYPEPSPCLGMTEGSLFCPDMFHISLRGPHS